MLRILSTDGTPVDPDAERWIDSEVDDQLLLSLLVDAVRARELDVLALRAARHGRLKGYYPAAGQESIVGLAHAMAAQDWVFPAYREQGLRLARGITVASELAMFAGANAPWDPVEHRVMPANTAIGAHLPHAVGYARAQTLVGSDVVTVAVFGDGAVAEGDFHAAANLAGLWSAPAVLFCQNNQYAQSTPATAQSGGAGPSDRASGYGLPGVLVDGMDPLAVLRASREAIERARRGEGSTLIESVCYRFGGHSALDVRRRYRTRAEEAVWRERDPLLRLQALAARRGLQHLADEQVAAARAGVQQEAEAALVDLTRRTPPSATDAGSWVGAGSASADARSHDVEAHSGPGALAAASSATLAQLMREDERIVVIGEDVRDGGVLGATEGLAGTFGDRVMDAPLNECGIVGAAIGMALAGLRPVADIAFAGFALTAFDQLASHAARYRWRSAGALTVPLVVRMPSGGGHGGYEGHNESIEALVAHTPGLVVLAPSSIIDTLGALETAVALDAPTVLLESTRTYLDPAAEIGQGVVEPLPLGRARVTTYGDPVVTLVTYGAAASLVHVAAEHLWLRDVGVCVVELRSVVPWDLDATLASVAATGRVLVVHDAPRTAGFGAEVLARVAESGITLRIAPGRLTQPDMPYGPGMWEPLTEVTTGDIVDAVVAMVGAPDQMRSSTTLMP